MLLTCDCVMFLCALPVWAMTYVRIAGHAHYVLPYRDDRLCNVAYGHVNSRFRTKFHIYHAALQRGNLRLQSSTQTRPA
jgi:hypothetical protein